MDIRTDFDLGISSEMIQGLIHPNPQAGITTYSGIEDDLVKKFQGVTFHRFCESVPLELDGLPVVRVVVHAHVDDRDMEGALGFHRRGNGLAHISRAACLRPPDAEYTVEVNAPTLNEANDLLFHVFDPWRRPSFDRVIRRIFRLCN
jgi:hypothetical protein